MTQHIGQTAPAPGGAPVHPVPVPVWRPWSAAWTRQVPPVADRDDLTVLVTPGAGQGAPACFTPADAVIEVDADHIDADPALVDPTDPAQRPMYAAGWGLLVHEAAHARHTRWDDRNAEPLALQAAELLEEPRIEARQLRRRPADRRWLHAATTKLILDQLDTHDTPWTAATAAALLLARADAGILTSNEVAPVRQQVVKVLGRKRLRKLEVIWRRALRTRDDDTAAMLEWGRRWCRILAVPPAGPLPAPVGTGTGAIRGAAGGVILVIADGLAADAAADAAAIAAATRARTDARQAETRQRRANTAAAAQVFGKGTTRRGGRRSPGRTRPPTEQEKTAARQLTRALRSAAHREATATRITSATPPGRLHTRAAMTEHVQRSLGQRPDAEPWMRTVRKANPQPPLRVGICTDASSSMGAFIAPAASTGWVIAQAVDRIADSQSASVTFGEHVTAITRPGRAPALVREYDLEGATTGFPTAVDALDHTLGLSQAGHAARLLVVISDGIFWDPDITAGQARLDRLAKTGCGLLWIGPTGSRPLTGTQEVILDDPTQAGPIIARAAATALAAAA